MTRARAFVVAVVMGTLVIVPACGSDDAVIFDPRVAGDGGQSIAESGSPDGPSTNPVSTACPPYMSACAGGTCVPTVADPTNCGACGNACTGTLACSGGRCSETCLGGQTKCGNRCVDAAWDSANCGGCGNVCAAGSGCVDGSCKPSIAVGTAGPCGSAAGLSPTNDSAQGGCLGELAQTVFRWTLCSCKDAQFSGNWFIDGFDSRLGPYAPGGLGASLGANESYGASGTGELWGTMWIAGSGGIAPSRPHTVKGDLRSGGELKAASSSSFTIGKDAYVAGEAKGDGTLSVGGTLFLDANKSVSGNVTRGGFVNDKPVTVVPPCDFCGPQRAVPIGAIVAAHRTTHDNAAIGLDANALASAGGPIRLDLPCGEYFLSRISSSSHVTIVAHGRTALYIDGDVSPNGITLAADPSGELNVFIAGSLGTSGPIRIGSPAYPAVMRLYVGGTSGVTISDQVSIAGNLYVPNGPVTYSSAAEQYGAIYAATFSASKDIKLHYDVAITSASVNTCTAPPPAGPSTPPPPSPSGGRVCSSCNECGNQACIAGKCGDVCSASETCCAPLVCVNGACVASVK